MSRALALSLDSVSISVCVTSSVFFFFLIRHNDPPGPSIQVFIIIVVSSWSLHLQLPDDLFLIYTHLPGDTVEPHNHTSPRALFVRDLGFLFLGTACIKDSINCLFAKFIWVVIGHRIGRAEMMLVGQQHRITSDARWTRLLGYIAHYVVKPKLNHANQALKWSLSSWSWNLEPRVQQHQPIPKNINRWTCRTQFDTFSGVWQRTKCHVNSLHLKNDAVIASEQVLTVAFRDVNLTSLHSWEEWLSLSPEIMIPSVNDQFVFAIRQLHTLCVEVIPPEIKDPSDSLSRVTMRYNLSESQTLCDLNKNSQKNHKSVRVWYISASRQTS